MTLERATVAVVFPDLETAERAIRELRGQGFGEDQIGFAMKNTEADRGGIRTSINPDEPQEHAAQTGAVLGGVLGGALGTAVAGVVPGVGPVILGAVLATIGGGALVGGLVGQLVEMGIPEEEAQFFEAEFKKGHPIVTVHTEDNYSGALAILTEHGGYGIDRLP